MSNPAAYPDDTCERWPDCDPNRCPRCKSERFGYADDVSRTQWACSDCDLIFDGCTDCQAARRHA